MRKRAIRVAGATAYAKYHATRARLLAHGVRWTGPMPRIASAIERERSGQRHYVLCIGNYQSLRLSMLFDQGAAEELRRRQESARSEFSAVQEQVRELQDCAASSWSCCGLLRCRRRVRRGRHPGGRRNVLRDGVALMAAIAGGILAAFAGSTSCSSPSDRPGADHRPHLGFAHHRRRLVRRPFRVIAVDRWVVTDSVHDRGHGVDEDRIARCNAWPRCSTGPRRSATSASPASVDAAWIADIVDGALRSARRDRRPRWST